MPVMTRREALYTLALSALSPALAGAPPDATTSADGQLKTFIAWARSAAAVLQSSDPDLPVDDLEPLRAIVGDARIVGVGESFHGGREFLRMRHRVTRFLIERLGFDSVAYESGLPEGKLIYDYVLGGEKPARLWEEGFTWTFGDYPEIRALVEWLRAFNMRTGGRVRFYGIDVAGARGSWLSAAGQVFTYLDKVDPAWSSDIRGRLTPLLTNFARPGRTGLDFVASNDAFAKLPLDERTAVAAYLNELFDRFENLRLSYLRASSAEEFDWARQIAFTLRASSNLVTCYEARNRPHPVWNARDADMAANVEWIRQRGSPGGGVVVLAHNGHVQGAVTTAVDPTMANCGTYLRNRFDAGYRTLGFTFGSGSMPTETGSVKQLPRAEPDSLDGALSRIGVPLALLDLRGVPQGAPAVQWLTVPRKQRIQDFYVPYDQLKSWDGLFYVGQVSASSPPAG